MSRRVYKGRFVLFSLLLVLGAVLVFRRVAIGIHIDEEYIVALGYRSLAGDSYFLQNQEPQILLTPFLSLLEFPFILVTGSTEGILVYLRIVTQIFLVLESVFIYRELSRYVNCKAGLCAAVFVFCYQYRYLSICDYTFCTCLASTNCFLLWLNSYTKKEKISNAIWAGIFFSLMTLCFPSLVILFPLYCWVYSKKSGRKNIGLILLCCLCLACVEIIVLFNGKSLGEIPELIAEIISNSSYGKDAGKADKIPLFIGTLAVFVVVQKYPNAVETIRRNIKRNRKILLLVRSVSGIGILFGLLLVLQKVAIEGDFYNRNGYLCLLGFGALYILSGPFCCNLLQMFLWGILCDQCVGFMTRYDTQGIYALPSFLAIYVCLALSFERQKRVPNKVLACMVLLLMLGQQLLVKDFWMINNVAVTDKDYIFNQNLSYISEGPAAGVWARKIDAEKYDELYNWIVNNIHQETKVCYFGKNVLVYLMSPYIRIAVPQMFMDYANDMVLPKYYEENPQYFPELVILDISATSKRQIWPAEEEAFSEAVTIYKSDNYWIFEENCNT